MMSQPAIIFNVKYHKIYSENYVPKDTLDEERVKASRFYRSPGIVSYLNRSNACDKTPDEEDNTINDLLNNSSADQKTILGYVSDRPGSTGSFNNNGDLTKEDLKNITAELSMTQSIIWSGVISFTPEFASSFCDSKKKAKELMVNTVEKMFDKSGLKSENVNWFAAYHTNTEHPHIHLLFWEKEPLKISSTGVAKFSGFKLKKEGMASYPADINYYYQKANFNYFNLRDEIKDAIKLKMKDSPFTFIMNQLDTNIKSSTSQYARLTLNERQCISLAFQSLINCDQKIKEKYDSYISALNKTQKELIYLRQELNPHNKINIPQNILNFASNRISELYNRCGNEILKTLKTYRENKKEITKNKFIVSQSPSKIKTATINRKSKNTYLKNLMKNSLASLGTALDEKINYLFDRSLREYYAKLEEENREFEKERREKIHE